MCDSAAKNTMVVKRWGKPHPASQLTAHYLCFFYICVITLEGLDLSGLFLKGCYALYGCSGGGYGCNVRYFVFDSCFTNIWLIILCPSTFKRAACSLTLPGNLGFKLPSDLITRQQVVMRFFRICKFSSASKPPFLFCRAVDYLRQTFRRIFELLLPAFT